MYQRTLFVFFIFLISPFVKAQDTTSFIVAKSLEPEWNVYAAGQFRPFNPEANERPRAIYFLIEANKYQGSFLKCSSNAPFSLFMNHQLIKTSRGSLLLNLDSLSRKYSSRLQCVIFQRSGIERLTTQIVKATSADAEPALTKRKANYFFDFSIMASLFVLAYFIVLIRTLPRLATNYFNVLRLVSLQEREENIMGSRVSSTANMLFYVFGGLLAGLVLTIVFYYGSAKTSFPLFFIDSVWDGFSQWIKWSALVLILLLFKLVLTYALSAMFNIGELVPFYFFNFLRLHFFVFGMGALLSLGYFIFKGQSPEFYSYLFYGIGFITFFWVILIYLKLLTKVPFRFFHLFSYLCISEIIPMVIIFKILLF
jgi:hypothetical protein